MTVENWLEFVGWAACAGTFSWLAVGLLIYEGRVLSSELTGLLAWMKTVPAGRPIEINVPPTQSAEALHATMRLWDRVTWGRLNRNRARFYRTDLGASLA